MEAKWLPKCFKNQAPVREASGRALGSDFGRFLEGPRGSPEAPESAPGAPGEPQEVQNELQEAPNDSKEAPNDPQEGEKEPQEGQSELWEASGSVLGRISDAFPSNARRPRRSLLKPPARARSARARLQAGAAARMFSQPSPGSSQKAPKKTHEKLTAVPRGALPCFFSPLLVLVSSSSPSLAMLAALASHALPVPSIARFLFLGVFRTPSIFEKMQHFPCENLVF